MGKQGQRARTAARSPHGLQPSLSTELNRGEHRESGRLDRLGVALPATADASRRLLAAPAIGPDRAREATAAHGRCNPLLSCPDPLPSPPCRDDSYTRTSGTQPHRRSCSSYTDQVQRRTADDEQSAARCSHHPRAHLLPSHASPHSHDAVLLRRALAASSASLQARHSCASRPQRTRSQSPPDRRRRRWLQMTRSTPTAPLPVAEALPSPARVSLDHLLPAF